MMKPTDAVMDLLGNEVNKFLMEQGGLDNGYITWVQGEVLPDIHSAYLEWLTPKAEELTGIQKHKLGCDLYRNLQKIMLDNELERIKFERKHLEDGCYATTVKVIYSRRVRLRRTT
jgi:hypothetical protein